MSHTTGSPSSNRLGLCNSLYFGGARYDDSDIGSILQQWCFPNTPFRGGLHIMIITSLNGVDDVISIWTPHIFMNVYKINKHNPSVYYGQFLSPMESACGESTCAVWDAKLHSRQSIVITSNLTVQPLVQADNKENIAGPHYWSFCGESTGEIIPHKGPVMRKAFPCRAVVTNTKYTRHP